MSPNAARPHVIRRLVATIALALIAATGISVATAPTASASASAVSDGRISVTVSDMTIVSDAGVLGRPDVGEMVEFTVTVAAIERVSAVGIWQDGAWRDGKLLATSAGNSETFTVQRMVRPGNLGHLGSGPTFGDVTVSYAYKSGPGLFDYATDALVVAGPPAFYTPGVPFTVATTMDITENGGLVDGVVREGDTVGYTTTVTNTSGYVMVLDSLPGYDDFTAPVVLHDGASVPFQRAPVAVTYGDMAAGLVDFPDTEIAWRAGYTQVAGLYSGTFPVAVGFVLTEAIDTSFTSDVVTAVHTSGGGAVALGDAVAGDDIDYTFQLSNDGNVVLNYVTLVRNWSVVVGGTSGVFPGPMGLVQGASLPFGGLPIELITSDGGTWPAYPLQQVDIDRGYVDLGFTIAAAPSTDVFIGAPSTYEQAFTERVFLRNFDTKANLKFTKAQLNDTNGDGIGQAGETVQYRVRFKNNADQPLVIDSAGDAAGSDVLSPVGAAFMGQTVAVADVTAKQWAYTLTPADEARGTVDAGIDVGYHGDVDGATNSRTQWADTILTGVYVAPASTLDTAATYTDANADGFPSIGETVTVTVTVTNTGSYALTGLTVADAAGSDVPTGSLPAFPTSIAGGGSAIETFDYVLTAADFVRGTFGYSAEMTATGLPTTASSTSVSLTGITFQAYATDLDTMPAGGISVCNSDGTHTDTIVLTSTIIVVPGDSCSYAGLSYGYRVVGFSTPLLMGTNTFTVTVPIALHVGPHRLALYAPNGTLVGWKNVTAKDPIGFAGPGVGGGVGGGALAGTGANSDEVVGLGGSAVMLTLLGTAFVLADSRRRKHAAR